MIASAEPRPISLTINGESVTVHAEPRALLSDVLRHDCGLYATHVGCEHGVCGACTVLVNGEAIRSCLMLAVQAEGATIQTAEGLTTDGKLHALQQAMHEEHGLQCGFCTPGILMTVLPWLETHPDADEAEIRELLSGNLCRCTGYVNIVRAVQRALREQ
jgi:aerobic-type carbon monoxide dehydrogenase small subunit (CoxS/CutS family)